MISQNCITYAARKLEDYYRAHFKADSLTHH